MSVPEISHRCPSCGVSIRDFGERVLFCPECGKAMTRPAPETANEENSPPRIEKTGTNNPAQAAVASSEKLTSANTPLAEDGRTKKPVVEDRHRARERTRETLHRASSMARGAIEDNVKRVEKIHHVSTVMLEEATYDPSLRFVLVAVGLFVVFVILLILSKVMG